MERRMTEGENVQLEERADGRRVLSGYAAVFYRADNPGTEYRLAPDLVERIERTAFTRAIQEKHDARGLFNHDPNVVLGRVSAGTMRLSVDDHGLRYEIDLPDTQAARDVAESIKRRDISGSSFAFRVAPQGQRFERAAGGDVRHILDVDLFDAGPVTYPAYQATTTGLRSGECEDAFQERNLWRRGRESEAVAVRLRAIALDNEGPCS